MNYFQTALDDISRWARDNNMLINASKTKILHLSLSDPKYIPTFTMDGHTLEVSSNAKLLGITVDQRITFSDHIDDICDRLAGRRYGIRELKRLGLNAQGLRLYYTANIRSVLTYTCPMWGSIITKRPLEKVIQVERQAMKVMNSHKCTMEMPYVIISCQTSQIVRLYSLSIT